jgi:hypothetical protein
MPVPCRPLPAPAHAHHFGSPSRWPLFGYGSGRRHDRRARSRRSSPPVTAALLRTIAASSLLPESARLSAPLDFATAPGSLRRGQQPRALATTPTPLHQPTNCLHPTGLAPPHRSTESATSARTAGHLGHLGHLGLQSPRLLQPAREPVRPPPSVAEPGTSRPFCPRGARPPGPGRRRSEAPRPRGSDRLRLTSSGNGSSLHNEASGHAMAASPVTRPIQATAKRPAALSSVIRCWWTTELPTSIVLRRAPGRRRVGRGRCILLYGTAAVTSHRLVGRAGHSSAPRRPGNGLALHRPSAARWPLSYQVVGFELVGYLARPRLGIVAANPVYAPSYQAWGAPLAPGCSTSARSAWPGRAVILLPSDARPEAGRR